MFILCDKIKEYVQTNSGNMTHRSSWLLCRNDSWVQFHPILSRLLNYNILENLIKIILFKFNIKTAVSLSKVV